MMTIRWNVFSARSCPFDADAQRRADAAELARIKPTCSAKTAPTRELVALSAVPARKAERVLTHVAGGLRPSVTNGNSLTEKRKATDA